MDEDGKIIEATNFSDTNEVHLGVSYDSEGRPTYGEVIFKENGGVISRIEIAFEADNRMSVKSYYSDGTLLSSTESVQGDVADRSCESFTRTGAGTAYTAEKIRGD